MRLYKSSAGLWWRGPQSVRELAARLSRREPATLHLPASYHHALCVRLCAGRGTLGAIDVTGDAALLRKIAAIEGLGELASLCEDVTKAAVRVRLRSPAPKIHFISTEPMSRRAPPPNRQGRSAASRASAALEAQGGHAF